MAYLTSLAVVCANCNRPATQRLFNAVNVPVGAYCSPCAQRELRAQLAKEAKQHADQSEYLLRWARK